MHINDDGLALLKKHEGLRVKAYLCAAGIWTIGYGHTGDVMPAQQISQEHAEQLLLRDVMRFETGVGRVVRVPLNENQFSALVCFAFNVGLGAFSASTLLQLLNRGWYSQVPAQLMRWTKVKGVDMPGLTARRQDEVDLWNTLVSGEVRDV